MPPTPGTHFDRAIAEPRWPRPAWLLCGLVLCGLVTAIAVILNRTEAGRPTALPVWLPTLLSVAANAVYLAAVILLPRRMNARTFLAISLLVGAAMRAAMWFTPILPNGDVHRYMWDGAVTAAGVNPYRYSPQQVLDSPAQIEHELRQLAQRGHETLLYINHPQLRTMYPPAAQMLFAVAYWLAPFELDGWRAVLLAFDVLAALLLWSLLGRAGRPIMYMTIYLWNPLLITETYHGGHLDLTVAALVLLTVWLLSVRRVVPAAAVLAVAAGVKLWPALLIFLVLYSARADRRRLAAAAGVFLALSALMALPFAAAAGGDNSGLAAYSQTWLANAGLYLPLRWLGWKLSALLAGAIDGGLWARCVVAAALVAVAVFKARRSTYRPDDLCARAGTIVLVMLLLSPTLYPWYYLPVIALAALAPAASLLAWTVLLPLSYLPLDLPPDRLNFMTVVIHLPVWLFLLTDWARRRKQGRQNAISSNV